MPEDRMTGAGQNKKTESGTPDRRSALCLPAAPVFRKGHEMDRGMKSIFSHTLRRQYPRRQKPSFHALLCTFHPQPETGKPFAGHKKAPVRNLTSHTPARVKSRSFFRPLSFPSLYKMRKKRYTVTCKCAVVTAVYGLWIHMQGAECSSTLSLLCTFYCALQFLL